MKLLHTAALLAITTLASAAPTQISKVSGWTIYKTTDGMSDDTYCIAIFDKQKNVAMTKERLTINMAARGGVKAYQFRYDNEAPSMFASRMDSDLPDIWWTGDIQRIVGSKKLLVRIEPIIGPITDFDIDLRAALPVQTVLLSPKCH